ncbi:LexA family protein [Halomonas koreensis]|uniref:S24 family peptidase n=1 Tax=Halomonas koreensis TaxID=245385 RepID=A0ABU1G301_9GAMM|nr:S24 family peptidase [Halomonas koreensis]MDR5867270.1 S24 family peptidase [Halomonas koreensis]
MNKRERIIAAIEHAVANGVKKREIADFCRVSRTAVTQWSKGDVEELKYSNLRSLAQVAGISEKWLAEGKGHMVDGTREPPNVYGINQNVEPAPAMHGAVPVISWVQAGAWSEVCVVDLDPEETEWLPRPPGASDDTFALRVAGESMAPRYNPGTLIYVDPAVQPEGGDDVVAVLTDTNEATFKRFVQEPGGDKLLMALNPDWPRRYLEINGNCSIVGVVIADMNLRRR